MKRYFHRKLGTELIIWFYCEYLYVSFLFLLRWLWTILVSLFEVEYPKTSNSFHFCLLWYGKNLFYRSTANQNMKQWMSINFYSMLIILNLIIIVVIYKVKRRNVNFFLFIMGTKIYQQLIAYNFVLWSLVCHNFFLLRIDIKCFPPILLNFMCNNSAIHSCKTWYW